jgi:hypothetical protein
VEGEGGTEVYASPGYTACGDAYPEAVVNGDLQLPSFDQTGIKVQLPHEELVVTEGQAYVVDFDVPESFAHEAGNSEKWVMHPVIKAEDMGLSQTITVELTLEEWTLPPIKDGETVIIAEPTLGDYFQATLNTETEPAAFSDPDANEIYTATFLYLVPGEPYEVSVGLKDGLSLDFVLDPDMAQAPDFGGGSSATVSFVVKPPPPPNP